MVNVKTHSKIVKEVVDPKEFFSNLSLNGSANNSVFFESADIVKKTGQRSIGCISPSLRIVGKADKFEIFALKKNGEKLITHFKDKFFFAENIKVTKDKISGTIKKQTGEFSEEEKMYLPNLADVLRVIAFEFKPEKKFDLSMGIFGVISYDFIDQFENISKNKIDLTKDPDVEMFFCDNLFIIDHIKKETSFFVNDLFGDNKYCEEILEGYEKTFKKSKIKKEIKNSTKSNKKFKIKEDTSKDEFIKMIKTCKNHLIKGNNFQLVPSKTKIVTADADPFLVYDKLRDLNPGPYMFYFKSSDGILLGSSPETFLKVEERNNKKIALLTPIAGTKPRGTNKNGEFDYDLDSRYENELRSDKKEISEHNMLIDLARNDIARISKAGTRYVSRPHFIVKYSHVMHLVSEVIGELRDDYDVFHAYLAVINMGTLCGTPKVKAMDILRKIEKTKRGFYAGAIGFITPHGNMDTAMIIRSSRFRNGKIYVRSGAGIVYDSIPESEYIETENKAAANIKAIKIAMGIDDEKN